MPNHPVGVTWVLSHNSSWLGQAGAALNEHEIAGGKGMATEALTAVVVGYADTKTALGDFGDLEGAQKEKGLSAYDAAVIERTADSAYRVVATTVNPRNTNMVRAAGLGAIVGVVFAPAIAVAAVGAAVGALIGTVVDRFDAVSHGDMVQTRRLVDQSAAYLIVITGTEDAERIEAVALSRENRTIIPLSPTDVDALKRELQSEHGVFG
jgi:uncharacterized membrane protein